MDEQDSEGEQPDGTPELPSELEEKVEEFEQKIPPELRPEVRRHLIEMASFQQSFHSPIPPPDVVERYEKIQPGATDRFLKLVENQAKHRQKMEEKMIGAEVADRQAERSERQRGQWLGFAIGSLAIISGSVVAGLGQPWAGGFIGCGGVAGLVSVFVMGRKAQQEPIESETLLEDSVE